MPVIPNSAYVSMETVTQLMRVIANDMLYSPDGEILTDTANFMLPLLNDSLEWFTEEMNNHGIDTFTKETILTPLTATPGAQSTDPATQTFVNDSGYFDGVGLHIGPQLQLPPDLLNPLDLWERQTGSQEEYVPMIQWPDGLPSVVPSSRIRFWDYRQDGLYMPGFIQSNDIRLRYKGSLANFVSTQDILYFRGATGPLAYKAVGTYLASKNPEAAVVCNQEAQMRVSQIATRNARQKQRESVSRMSYGFRGRGFPFFPPRNQ